jgi:hypothetical protein
MTKDGFISERVFHFILLQEPGKIIWLPVLHIIQSLPSKFFKPLQQLKPEMEVESLLYGQSA